ncbi:hypothetical protein [Photobacterium aquae]|uniref:hypothetical protein n=1 Tax=Photobacterium aquae TaxID=1195763 RepID=UPI001F0B628B|nr:hypothetical protein [Photobacterium aquae]
MSRQGYWLSALIAFTQPLVAQAAGEATWLPQEMRGRLAVEHRQFFATGTHGQDTVQPSVVIEPEWYWEWEQGTQSVNLVPFARWDAMDNERSHIDLREAIYAYYGDRLELRAGIGKVFWGVTESQHLVDVINQTDAVESVDGEAKLGQPMVHFAYLADLGVWELFVLPYFRERTFAGSDGRLTVAGVNTDEARYESSRGKKHVDLAARYSVSWDVWDIGLSYFHGTSRDPYFLVEGSDWLRSLVPFYAQMDQLSVDLQGLWGDWLWKLEALRRFSLDNHSAVTAGFEYTYVGVADTAWDVGVLAEYLYDSREKQAPVVGQNDIFAGVRWALNDIAGTEVLFGVSQDLDDARSQTARLEASSRLGSAWRWNINAWYFDADDERDPVYGLRRDNYVEVGLSYYF